MKNDLLPVKWNLSEEKKKGGGNIPRKRIFKEKPEKYWVTLGQNTDSGA